ncbi:MAG: aspartate/glutamate racemase family protein [Candidatus Eremiobacteraeota bacterium]|nr:aspartate/glutamate racemase family protein [Candidatus Eremiobacteraeota bacterium]
MALLDERGVAAIVMGCNTSCAIAATYGWPESRAPILDLIDAAAEAAAAAGAHRIGVLATNATAGSGAYGNAIRRRAPAADVQEFGAPALVPLVEAGLIEGAQTREAVAEACAQFTLPLDTLVLACSHYPLLDAHFAAALGAGVPRIDPAVAQAARAVAVVRSRNGAPKAEGGRTTYLTNGPLEPFRAAVISICGPLGPSDQVEVVVGQVHADRS